MAPRTEQGPTDSARGRGLGAAVGISGALAAAYGSSWGGIGDSRFVVVATLALASGALIGGLAWPVLQGPGRPGALYGGLFGGVTGMLAGTFAGFPLGGVFGAGGGALGGAVALLTWGAAPERLDAGGRAMLAAAAGLAAGGLTGLWMAA